MTGRASRIRTRTRLAALLAAATAGLAGLAIAGPASARPAAAGHEALGHLHPAGPARPGRTPIKHVVVLYLENQSFDSILGYWCKRHLRRCPDGGMPTLVRLSDGKILEPGVLPDIVPDIAHGITPQARAIDGGKMDGWQKEAGCSASTGYACVAGYKASQVPNVARLAEQFAISDKTFSMAASPSWGGHLYAVADTLDGFRGANPHAARGVQPYRGWGCDANKISPWITPRGGVKQEPSCIPDYHLGLANGGAFRATPVKYVPTILDRLSNAGLTWRLFGEPNPPGQGGSSPAGPSGTGGLVAGYVWDICPSFAECLYSNQKANNVPSSTFVRVAERGKLPNFSLITPGGVDAPFSEHNGFSITAGDDWLGQIASAVMNGPQWRSTALFITWDDCGCFYDKLPPGVNPDGTNQGPRVPLVIVSPYARPGFTDRTATTFAGILGFTERTFGLKPLGVNDRFAYPFTGAFNYKQRPLAPVPMTNRPWPPDAYHVNMKEANQDT